MSSREERLAAAAAANHAVVDVTSGAAAGLSQRQLRQRAAAGSIRRAHENVWVIAGAPETHEQRLLAGVLACGPDAAACRRAGAWLWEYDGFTTPGPLEVTVEHGCGPAPKGVIVHRTKRFDPIDRTVHRGIPVTTRERTLIDLGAVVRPYLVQIAVESYLRSGGSEAKLRARLEAVAGRGCRGVGVLRAILDGRPIGARPSGSPKEVDFLDLCRRIGVEDPVAQHPVSLFDGSKYVIDWAWPQHRALVEIQGYDAHGARRADFDRDADRRVILRSMGYRYLEFTGKQLEREWLVLRALRAEIPELFRNPTG